MNDLATGEDEPAPKPMTPAQPEILKRAKALSVSPLKASATLGAALAFLGFRRAIPMLHGSQGCTAFGKVFFVRHFREPIPLQTTAIEQVSAIMGSEDHLVEGLRVICEKNAPVLIGVPTTGLVETQGCDIRMAVKNFRSQYPQYARIAVVPVATPDFTGSLESGYALATQAIIDWLVPTQEATGPQAGQPFPRGEKAEQPLQVNVLAGSHLTPGDLEHLKGLIEAFGLQPVVMPDLSDSLDGHLPEEDFSPLTLGGASVGALATLKDAVATLVIGGSMHPAADLLQARTGVPDYRLPHLMGLEAVDALVTILAKIAARPVPSSLERQRAQLQDAMLDCHFMLGQSRFAIAAEPDLLVGFSQLLAGVGAETVAAVAPINAPSLAAARCERVRIGDLEDLEQAARAGSAEMVIGNAHAAPTAERLGVPLIRAGFPQYDRLGGYQRTWIGYQGTRATLFDLANHLLKLERGEVHPYRSRLSPRGEAPCPGQDHAA